MRLTVVCLLFGLTFFLPVFVHSGGGQLHFRQSVPADQLSPWVLHTNYFITEQMAQQKLIQNHEEGFLFDPGLQQSGKIFLTASQPYQLFFDVNNDQICQEDELYESQPANDLGSYTYDFQHVRWPLQVNDEVVTVLVHVRCYMYQKLSRLEVMHIESCYEGTINIDDQSLNSRLIFQTPNPHNNAGYGIVILDDNQDGKYNPFEDTWFSANGTGYQNDSAWHVTTSLEKQQVNVQLTLYTGEFGTLVVHGDNIHRIYLQYHNQSNSLVCLPKTNGSKYRLPVGRYTVNEAWLSHPGSSETGIYMEWNQNMNWDESSSPSTSFQIHVEEETNLELGGPLKLHLQAKPSSFNGIVFLNYLGHQNLPGWIYNPIHSDDIGKSAQQPAPSWDVLNDNGHVVASGTFEYG